MKRIKSVLFLVPAVIVAGLIFLNFRAAAQDVLIPGAPLPADVDKILTFSCTPCHSKDGGLMSKTKLNLSEWTNYSADKQKAKAAKIFEEVNKGAMPPKKAREKRPEIIPTSLQVEIIKKWSESFPAAAK